MIQYKPTNEIRTIKNINEITLIPLLNSVLSVKKGHVWITETATKTTLTQRKNRVIRQK